MSDTLTPTHHLTAMQQSYTLSLNLLPFLHPTLSFPFQTLQISHPHSTLCVLPPFLSYYSWKPSSWFSNAHTSHPVKLYTHPPPYPIPPYIFNQPYPLSFYSPTTIPSLVWAFPPHPTLHIPTSISWPPPPHPHPSHSLPHPTTRGLLAFFLSHTSPN